MTASRKPVNSAADEIIASYFPVLDHGFVSLIDYMGSDESIDQAARVSYGFGTRPQSQTRTLLRYLRRHLHTTPSEMVELKFHCCMPIFVARQWIRHRMASVNEYSGRYSLVPTLFYTPEQTQMQPQEMRNNQGRSGAPIEQRIYDEAVDRWSSGRRTSEQLYDWLNSNKVARELARIDLPLSTYTQWYWKIDLHNLLHFLTLRVDSHAQWEIREYAKVIAGILKKVAPISFEAWVDYDACGVRMSRMELAVIRNLLSVDQGVLRASSKTADEKALIERGMSKREVLEFYEKLTGSQLVPDFELDLSSAKSHDYFQEKFKAAVVPDAGSRD